MRTNAAVSKCDRCQRIDCYIRGPWVSRSERRKRQKRNRRLNSGEHPQAHLASYTAIF